MSAGLALGLAGAAIGAPFGFASIGWTIGSVVGGMLDAPDSEGPRLKELGVQVSSLGAPIPQVFATGRLPGNIIWPLNFEVDEHSHTESAKGGPENTSYSYTATFAVLFCKGPKAGIGNLYANKKLIRDRSDNRDPCISGLRFMLGGEDQEPDPLMVARDGSAPAYRDSVIVVFENLDLTDFGNRLPMIEAEVFSNSEVSGPAEPRVSYDGDAAPISGSVIGLALVDPETGYIWSTSPNLTFGATVETYVTDDLAQSLLTNISTALANNVINSIVYVPNGATGREIWVMGWTFIAQDRAVIYNADSLLHEDTVDLGYRGSMRMEKAAYDPVTGKVITIGYGGSVRVIDPVTRTVESGPFSIGLAGTVFVSAMIVTTNYLAVFSHGSYDKLTLLNLSDYSVYLSIDDPYAGLPYSGFAYDPAREKLIHMAAGGGGAYNVIDIATGAITGYTLLPAADADANYSASMSAVVYCPYNDKYIFGANATSGKYTTLYVVDPVSFATEHTWTYEAYDSGETTLLFNPLLTPKDDPAYLLSFDLDSIKRLNLGGTILGGPVTLASIVSDISTGDPFGLDAGDIDVSELTDLVDGYVIDRQMTRRAAIEPLQPAYFFDGVESDHKLKFVKRGQAPAVTISKDDRAAHVDGDNMPPDIKIVRGSELERPWRVDVNFIDAARDYQVANQYDVRVTRNSNDPLTLSLPILLTASKAKAVAIVNLYLAWATRTKFSFSTGNAYAKYEPTDVVTLPTEEVDYIARIVSRSDQGNGVIQWEAELEDIAVYDQDGIVAESNFVPQTIRDPGETILHLLDIPILRDADDDPSHYVTMAGTTDGWRGAQLFKSSDGGSTYDPMLSIASEATIGEAQSALGDFTAGNIFDEGNSVTVVLASGGPLVSATTEQVCNKVNTAILGAPGRWEVIRYKNADLIAADTYQLSGLLRGRNGTEWATGLHEVGDTFILASTITWRRPAASSSEIGLARLYKAPPFRTRLSAADAQSFTNTAIGLKPYSPVDVTAVRDGTDLVISWHARSRIGYGPLNANVPVGEATESYRIQIMDGAAVKRTLTSSTPTVTYESADQVTDWGSTTGPYVVQVAKVSAVVGAGYIQEETFA